MRVPCLAQRSTVCTLKTSLVLQQDSTCRRQPWCTSRCNGQTWDCAKCMALHQHLPHRRDHAHVCTKCLAHRCSRQHMTGKLGDLPALLRRASWLLAHDALLPLNALVSAHVPKRAAACRSGGRHHLQVPQMLAHILHPHPWKEEEVLSCRLGQCSISK